MYSLLLDVILMLVDDLGEFICTTTCLLAWIENETWLLGDIEEKIAARIADLNQNHN